jgi:carboxymethylenebutenolidase
MAACTVPGFAGAVEFYGRIVYAAITPNKPAQPLDLLLGLSCPLQCHFGEADPVCPPEHVDALERRLAGAPRAAQVHRYPGCGHAFLNPTRPTWNPEAAELAWARALHFLDHLAGAVG